MEDAQEYLGDADEMRGYLDRPVGETVAKLCAALGLDPEACAPDGAAWRVRRWISKRGWKKKPESTVVFPPSLPLMERDRRRSRQGGDLSPRQRTPVMTPHNPTLDASHPVPPHEGEGRPVE